MTVRNRASSPPPFWTAAALLGMSAVLLIALERFVWTGFAGTDSLTLVETSRVRTWSDLVALVSSPVMAGTTFASAELVYRPFVSLSFALDYAVWGPNPVGFHLTNLGVHLVATLAVWSLLRALGLSRPAGLIGSLLFGLHPVVMAAVPVIARRDSLVPVAAFTTSMAVLCRGVRAPGRQRWLWTGASLVLLAAALLSKESAFAACLLIPLVLYGAGRPRPPAARKPVADARLLIPYMLLAAVGFGLRYAILGRLGGYEGTSLTHMEPSVYRGILAAYSRFLLWPLGELFPASGTGWVAMAAGILVGLLAAAWLLPRRFGLPLAIGCCWILDFGVFHAAVKTLSGAWLAYFPLVGIALVAASSVDAVLATVRWPGRVRPSAMAAAGWLVMAGSLAAYSVATVRSSALFTPYDEWSVAGAVTARYIAAVTGCLHDAPSGTTVTLLNVPGALVGIGRDTDLLAPTLVAGYTVSSALDVAYPESHFQVTAASYGAMPPDVSALTVSCSGQGAARQVSATY